MKIILPLSDFRLHLLLHALLERVYLRAHIEHYVSAMTGAVKE